MSTHAKPSEKLPPEPYRKFNINFPASALLKHPDVTIIYDKEVHLDRKTKLDL